MKKIITIIRQGVSDPRHFVQAINLKWRYLLLVMINYLALATIATTVALSPVVRGLSDEMQGAIEHLPTFNVENNRLALAEDSKALYYTADNFQLVVDDQIDHPTGTLASNDALASKLDQSKPVNLFFLEDGVYVYTPIVDQLFKMDGLYGSDWTQDSLAETFQNFGMHNQFIVIGLVVSAFVHVTFDYFFILLVASLLCAIFNVMLNKPIRFGSRFKIMTLLSFIPLLVLQVANIFLGMITGQTNITLIILLFIYYLALRNHSRFVQKVMGQFSDFVEKGDFWNNDDKNKKE